jgi:Tfp pilus assembly protein PilX
MEPTMKHTLTQLHRPNQKGFAMLFTILLVSLILSIAISISNLTLKQAILSGLAKDSGIAFYQADAAVECGLQQTVSLDKFPLNTTVNNAPATFACGDTLMTLDATKSFTDYFMYKTNQTNNQPCFSIIFDKANADGLSRVTGSGFNVCTQTPRQVERTLEAKY